MKTSSDYLLGLQDPKSAGFRFAVGCPVTRMATCYAVLALEFEGAFAQMAPEKKSHIVSFLLSSLGPDGYFRDPLFCQEDVLSPMHDPSYFEEETTAFCLQALDALGAATPILKVPEAWANPHSFVSYVSSLSWNDPWLESNRLMFALSRLCYETEKSGGREHLVSVDKALDWLDTQQNEKTGFWHGAGKGTDPAVAMAATVHFAFFYVYRGRPMRFAERLVDSCLLLQAPHGLFSRATIGNTCFDYDALQLLDMLNGWTGHRKKDVASAMRRARAATQTLRNEDGGFADAKLRIPWNGRAPRFMAKRMTAERFTNCWKYLSCPSEESNVYSTWLRSMTLVLTGVEIPGTRSFRRLPFLGYRPS